MPISPISSGLNALSSLTATRTAGEPSTSDGFGDMITRTISEVSAAEATADRIAVGDRHRSGREHPGPADRQLQGNARHTASHSSAESGG